MPTDERPNNERAIPGDRDELGREEWRGTLLVLIAKGVIIAVMALFLVVSYDPPGLYWPLLFVVGFTLTGLVQLWLNSYRPDWAIARALVIAIDSVALAVVIAVPNPLSGFDLPPQYPYRESYFALLIVYIASVGYSYKPYIALVAGIACASAWAILALLVQWQPETVDWSALEPAGTTRAQILELVGNPYFFNSIGRFVEVLLIGISGVLIAGLVWRSRRQVRRLLAAERRRQSAIEQQQFVRETLGKYVPRSIARQIILDRGQLVPNKREATVLFADLEGFTNLSETISPDELLRVLNLYFEAAGDIITAHGGTINQFQGDAILASFNVPIADNDHIAQAVRASKALVDMVSGRTFEGQKLRVRVGLNTGELAAGAVGSSDRLSYTVHGKCVNIAARLEQLNKETGTSVLMTEGIAEAARDAVDVKRVGEFDVRGVSEPVILYTTA